MKNHGPAGDRIDEWWNRKIPLQDSTRRALVGKSRKESSKVEALKKASELRPHLSVSVPGAASRVFDKRPDKRRRGALDSAPGTQPEKCCLTKPTPL